MKPFFHCFLVFFAFAASASAEDPERNVSAHFSWKAPPGCVKETTLEASVEELLKRKVFVAESDADVLIEGRAEPRENGGWNGILELRARDGRALGTRSLVSDAKDCRAIEGPLAVVLALLVDLERRDVVIELPVTAEPPPEKPKPIPVSARPEPPPAPSPMHGASAFGLVGAYGLLPGFAFGIDARGEVEPIPGLRAGLELGVWPERRSNESGPGGGFSAWLVGALGCKTLSGDASAQVALCVGTAAGSISGSGLGLAEIENPHRFYADISGRADGSVRLFRPIALGGELGLAVPLARPRFFYAVPGGDEVTVHRVAPVIPFGGIFLRAEF